MTNSQYLIILATIWMAPINPNQTNVTVSAILLVFGVIQMVLEILEKK